jgi:hypothetical protein
MLKSFLIPSLLLTVAASVVSGTEVLAQTPAPAPSPTVTPAPAPSPAVTGLRTTDQVVDQLCDFLKAQQSFTFDMDVSYDDVLASGSKVQYTAYQKVWVQKPDRYRSDYVGDERNTRFYYDGKSFVLYSPNLDYYATKEAPATLDAVLDQIEAKYGVAIPMSNLVASDPCADLKSNIERTLFIGVDMVNRLPMYHILMIGDERDFQLWVTRDKQPLLRKAIITYKTLPGSPQYTTVLSNWNFKPQIPADTFTFTPPEGASKIEVLPAKVLPDTGDSTSPGDSSTSGDSSAPGDSTVP